MIPLHCGLKGVRKLTYLGCDPVLQNLGKQGLEEKQATEVSWPPRPLSLRTEHPTLWVWGSLRFLKLSWLLLQMSGWPIGTSFTS